MNILAIYPGFSPAFDDVAEVWAELAARGHRTWVVSGRSFGLKSIGAGDIEEEWNGVRVFRPFRDFRHMKASSEAGARIMRKLSTQLRPDLVLCSSQSLLHLAVAAAASSDLPIVLVCEYIGDDWNLLDHGRRSVLDTPARMAARRLWKRIDRATDVVITCCPLESPETRPAVHAVVRQIPWCHQWPGGLSTAGAREPRVVHVGLFAPRRNRPSFISAARSLLESSDCSEFWIVGPELDVDVISVLRSRYGSAVVYEQSLPRRDALAVIAESTLGFSPVAEGGWGFIGDCWAAKTPLALSRRTDYAVLPSEALWTAPDQLGAWFDRLVGEPELAQTLTDAGYGRYLAHHTAQAVADRFEDAFRTALAGADHA